MGKRPWLPFYASDWLLDPHVKAMSRVARSVYLDMLCLQWMHGPLPDDPAKIARMLGEDRRTIAAVWPSIRPRFGVDSASNLVQLRLESESNHARIVSDNRRNAANSRWDDDANAFSDSDAPSMQKCLPSQSQSQSQSQNTKISEETAAPGSASPSGGQISLKIQDPPKPKKPKRPTEVYEVVHAWQKGWLEKFKPVDGKEPEPDSADWKQAKNLLSKYGLEATLSYIDRFLADTNKHIAERGHLLRDLSSRIARYKKSTSQKPVGWAPPASHDKFTKTGDITDEL